MRSPAVFTCAKVDAEIARAGADGGRGQNLCAGRFLLATTSGSMLEAEG